jgi:hypothetical protein
MEVGGSCAYDTQRGRIWPLFADNVPYASYLDVASRQWVNVQGTPTLVRGYPDMVYSCYESERDIVVVATNRPDDDALSMYWFLADSNGMARTPVSFDNGSLPAASWGMGSLMYVPELSCIVYYTQQDRDAYYEIHVPTAPAMPWSFERREISGQLPSMLPIPPSPSTYHRLDYSPALGSLLWVTGAAKSHGNFGGQVLVVRIHP